MLRNTGKASTAASEKAKEKNKIYNKRIDKEIQNLKQSKLLDDSNVYITVSQENEEQNSDPVVFGHSLDNTESNTYLLLLETFSEEYFQSENFFVSNFINHIKVVKEKIKGGAFPTSGHRSSNTSLIGEVYKYGEYKNSLCPFFGVYETLCLESIFESFQNFLSEICFFRQIFETFKNGFMREQRIFGGMSEEDRAEENSPWDSRQSSEFSFFTNTFFEIIYKDFTTHLQTIQREIIIKLQEGEEYEEESFYEIFSEFFYKYYSIKESVMFSFFVFEDYPFSKPYVNIENLPSSFFKKKTQKKLKGDKYNQKNILNILLHQKGEGWIPKITIGNLFEECQKFVHVIFFFYQYKVYLFFYYLMKHKIFELFLKSHCKVNLETYPLVYAYVAAVDKKIVAKTERKKNYSNLLYSIDNCECINQDFFLYKFFYNYKRVKRKLASPVVDDEGKTTALTDHLMEMKKKRYKYYIYLFFLLFLFFLPLFIKNVFIYQTEEIQYYLQNAGNSCFVHFENMPSDTQGWGNHPLFWVYMGGISKVSSTWMGDDVKNGHPGEGAHTVRGKMDKEGASKQGDNLVGSSDNREEGQEERVTNSTASTQHDGAKDNGISSNVKNAQNGGKSDAPPKGIITVLLAISEFLLFTLGIIYNLRLLKKRIEHNNLVLNICSAMLILYSPIFISKNTNYVTTLSLGLLFWAINLILQKKMYMSICVYFISIYFDLRNLSFFVPFLFIYVYISSMYVRRKGNKVKTSLKNWCHVCRYVLLYLLSYGVITYFLFYIFSSDQIGWMDTAKRCARFLGAHLERTGEAFPGRSHVASSIRGATTWNGSKHTERMVDGGGILPVGNPHHAQIFFLSLIPHMLSILINYLLVVNTIAKLYVSLAVSCIIFFFTSWGDSNSCDYFLTVLCIFQFLFINVVRSSSILFNVLISSFIVLACDSFNVYLFWLSIFYFLVHIYLMFPWVNFLPNVNYHFRVFFHLVCQLCRYVVCNLLHLYETCIKDFALSFVVILFPHSSVIAPLHEKNTQYIIQRKEIQRKIIFCLCSHLSRDFLHLPLTCFSLALFLLLGFLRLHTPQRSLRTALCTLKCLVVTTLLAILLLFYTKRKQFRKLDFLSIPQSARKRAFPLERPKKL
ncbi:Uncharacterized protein PCOAH_00049800 [Plasmodium coatneyi]|uniref:Uncharacterized protein n=1 Tax=Plasmodium coatneyi TaxID=208452 RepID=A0A1B1E6Q0_9APIC|nr:Uncharacterized protein PCOAH_00049800 [Plasmodium coatneyi]ANQ10714.1 Uncharacterized protein PCOAH_00049800 [Plasmodium coatneyi]